MAYCRYGWDSDIYVYATGGGMMTCHGLGHADVDATYMGTPQQMYEHMTAHATAGHRVPQRALDRLREELEEDK